MQTLNMLTEDKDFRVATNYAVAIAATLLLFPFSLNNFFQGRPFIGVISLFIVLVLVLNVWLIKQQRFNPALVFLGLIPAVIVFLFFSFEEQGVIGALWCYPAIIVFYIILPERNAWLANIILLIVAGGQSWLVFDTALVLRFVATMIGVSVFSALFIRIIESQKEKLERMVVTDPLTGLRNRWLLELSLEQTVFRCQRNKSLATLVFMDLDHFKRINDEHGHDAGDRVLMQVGELIRNRVRRNENAFRMGGEEFLLLLEDTDERGAMKVAESIRETLMAERFDDHISVTASFGVATYQQGETWPDWLKRCDRNLYKAKAAGRNTVVADQG